jgi:hypothetical protein
MYNIGSIVEGHQTVPIYWEKAMLMNSTNTTDTTDTSAAKLLLLTAADTQAIAYSARPTIRHDTVLYTFHLSGSMHSL